MSRFLHGSGVGVAGAAPELACCGPEGSPSAGVAGGGFMTGSTYFRQLKSSRYKQITPSSRTHGRIGRPEQRRQYPSCPVRVFWPPASHRSFCPESPPSWAINRITVLAVSTVLGTAFLFRMKGARHSSASNSRSVRQGAPQAHEAVDAPGNDHVQSQRRLQLFDVTELEFFHLQPGSIAHSSATRAIALSPVHVFRIGQGVLLA